MIEVLIAFGLGALATGIPGALALRAANKRESGWSAERVALLDRIQSPDLAAYYGARAAWHPEEFPAPPEVDYLRDDYGYLAEPVDPREDGRLPGELPPSEL